MKQQGAILAKGRLLGVQFEAILKNGLYLELAAHANRLAERLTQGLTEMNIPLLTHSPSNQVFPVFPNCVVEQLEKEFTFEIQERVDAAHTCVRFVTAWCSTEDDVNALLSAIKNAI